MRSILLFLLLPQLLLLFLPSSLLALPLSTSSRWIVDEATGQRVKLACVNWVSHLDTMVAEGLSKQPLSKISNLIATMGFNCVRLTWPLYLLTNDSLASLTVRQSFQTLGLTESIGAVRVHNPSLLDLTLIQAFKAVVSNLDEHNIMVILDNHVSKPGWCCSLTDGNGFFGDEHFDPDLWVEGLTRMAALFSNATNVIGMSLRNELRGRRQNVDDWYRYMQRGAEAVHQANPNVLVILSGLRFDNDLSHLSQRQVELTFARKLVFELHWYSFSNGNAWRNGNLNQVCGMVLASVMRRAGFLLDQGWPLFLSEFGVDQRGATRNDNRYFPCFLGTAAELDLDWALWALQGSYYIRQGVLGLDEAYGVLAWDWSKPRNSTFLQRISAIQTPFRGPGLSYVPTYTIIFHPSTGQCVKRKSLTEPLLQLGPCTEAAAWNYNEKLTLAENGKACCLKADAEGEPVKLGFLCGSSASKWELISNSKMHLSSRLIENGDDLCLDVGSDGTTIVTNACKCLDQDQHCDPGSQWFKMVKSTMHRDN